MAKIKKIMAGTAISAMATISMSIKIFVVVMLAGLFFVPLGFAGAFFSIVDAFYAPREVNALIHYSDLRTVMGDDVIYPSDEFIYDDGMKFIGLVNDDSWGNVEIVYISSSRKKPDFNKKVENVMYYAFTLENKDKSEYDFNVRVVGYSKSNSTPADFNHDYGVGTYQVSDITLRFLSEYEEEYNIVYTFSAPIGSNGEKSVMELNMTLTGDNMQSSRVSEIFETTFESAVEKVQTSEQISACVIGFDDLPSIFTDKAAYLAQSFIADNRFALEDVYGLYDRRGTKIDENASAGNVLLRFIDPIVYIHCDDVLSADNVSDYKYCLSRTEKNGDVLYLTCTLYIDYDASDAEFDKNYGGYKYRATDASGILGLAVSNYDVFIELEDGRYCMLSLLFCSYPNQEQSDGYIDIYYAQYKFDRIFKSAANNIKLYN